MSGERDPYVYPGTGVLINKEGIRDASELARFERMMSGQRMSEPLPSIGIDSQGYRDVHRHIFQDVYAWAGETRTVNIVKDSSPFCRAHLVDQQLEKRFTVIQSENALKGLKPPQFAERVAEHLSELNAVHPFREGNGRTMRAFLEEWGQQAGHKIELERIAPREWNEASRHSFQTGDARPMREVVEASIAPRTMEHERSIPSRDDREHERER